MMGALVALVFVMIALSFAAVPLYKIFCQATGFGGTTQRASQGAAATIDRRIDIRFNADTNRELPWVFKPNQRSVTLKVGETGLATFHAHNSGAEPLVGTAVYNVTPEKAGKYFVKIQCFCFTQQMLKPQESADLPVAFYVDPAISNDHNLDDVTVITLSYTFYKAQSQALDDAIGDEGRKAEIDDIDKAMGRGSQPAAKSPNSDAAATGALAARARLE